MVKIKKGINDLETWCRNNRREDLLEQWDYKKNLSEPCYYTKGSNKKVWWKCSESHSYEMCIYDRTIKKLNCPYCGSQRLLKGYNDLATRFPTISLEWDYSRNAPLTPCDVMGKSNKKVWWKCNNGHSFQSKIYHRTDNHGCPYCAGIKPIIGENDLKTLHPILCKQWDYNKNKIGPEQFLPSSNKKVWWLCEVGHSWLAVITSRVNNNRGCPICWKENRTSFSEQAVYYYIKKCFPDAINSDRNSIGMELDIYIPSVKIAVEYDGLFWHYEKDFIDKKKNKLCFEKGIGLIRLREQGLTDITESTIDNNSITILVLTKDNSQCDKRQNNTEGLEKAIHNLLIILGQNVNDGFIDINRDRIDIMSSYIVSRKNKSLSNLFPEIAAEWNDVKNGTLKPDMFKPHSNKKVWWKCSKGHEWESRISDRVKGRGCPICSNKKAFSGFNTLEITDPDLIKEWDFSKNTLQPEKVFRGSHTKVFWKCSVCSFEWQATIASRACGKRGCPKCGRIKVHKAQQKAVLNIDTGDIYESAKAAAYATGIGQSNIRNNCNGRSASAGSFHWKYIE